MDDWLKKRMTPARRANAGWSALAEVFQEYWDEKYLPVVQKMIDARSVFSAADDDLVTIMAELGDYFRDDINAEGDRPIQVLWRRLELQGKETENLIRMTIRRKFLGLHIEWMPLYAHKTDDYGTNFKSLTEIQLTGLSEDDFFLTSRGKIAVSSTSLDGSGYTFAEVLEAVEEELVRFLPTHIVYGGTEIVDNGLSMSLGFGGAVAEGTLEYVGLSGSAYGANGAEINVDGALYVTSG